MKTKKEHLEHEVESLSKRIDELRGHIVRIRLLMLMIEDEATVKAMKRDVHVLPESSLPKLEEAIACISSRYRDREEMAKLVIRNRDAGRNEILKLCRSRGWVSPNTGIDNVRFIDKILNLFK